MNGTLTAEELEALITARDEGRLADAYRIIHARIVATQGSQSSAAFWFQEAININSDSPSMSNAYIRNYTQIAALVSGTVLSTTALQAASNQIALNVIDTVIGGLGEIPLVESIIQEDVLVAVNSLGIPPSAWAGTPWAIYVGLPAGQFIQSPQDIVIIGSGVLAGGVSAGLVGYAQGQIANAELGREQARALTEMFRPLVDWSKLTLQQITDWIFKILRISSVDGFQAGAMTCPH